MFQQLSTPKKPTYKIQDNENAGPEHKCLAPPNTPEAYFTLTYTLLFTINSSYYALGWAGRCDEAGATARRKAQFLPLRAFRNRHSFTSAAKHPEEDKTMFIVHVIVQRRLDAQDSSKAWLGSGRTKTKVTLAFEASAAGSEAERDIRST